MATGNCSLCSIFTPSTYKITCKNCGTPTQWCTFHWFKLDVLIPMWGICDQCIKLLPNWDRVRQKNPTHWDKFYPDEEHCVICLDATPDCELKPCGHRVVCNQCVRGMKPKCPVCNIFVTITYWFRGSGRYTFIFNHGQ